MKRKIRAGTFETNSSSMHSLIVENFSKKFNPHKTETSSLKKDENGNLHVRLGEYGWGIEILDTQQKKLNYLVTSIVCYKWIDSQEDLEDDYDFMELSREICEYAGAEGIIVDNFKGEYYIDHDSNNGIVNEFIGNVFIEYKSNGTFKEKGFSVSAVEVVFNSEIKICISNDNTSERW